MQKQHSGISAEGRTPPPAESWFRKGRSGNPAGRPKGSISLRAITRKVALKKHSVRIPGKPRRINMLELLILKLNAMAASGHPGAASLINWLRSQTEPSEGIVVVASVVGGHSSHGMPCAQSAERGSSATSTNRPSSCTGRGYMARGASVEAARED